MNKRISKMSAKTELYQKGADHHLDVTVSDFDIDRFMKAVPECSAFEVSDKVGSTKLEF